LYAKLCGKGDYYNEIEIKNEVEVDIDIEVKIKDRIVWDSSAVYLGCPRGMGREIVSAGLMSTIVLD